MGDYDHEKNPKMRYPVDYFRKKFTLSGKVKHARLYMTACGLYETYLNGEFVIAENAASYESILSKCDSKRFVMEGSPW